MGVLEPIIDFFNWLCEKIAQQELWIILGLFLLLIGGVYVVLFT